VVQSSEIFGQKWALILSPSWFSRIYLGHAKHYPLSSFLALDSCISRRRQFSDLGLNIGLPTCRFGVMGRHADNIFSGLPTNVHPATPAPPPRPISTTMLFHPHATSCLTTESHQPSLHINASYIILSVRPRTHSMDIRQCRLSL
jgi:hypothetical protein